MPTTSQLIAWADLAERTMHDSDDYMTCRGADAVLSANVAELGRRADAGDPLAALWLGRGAA